MADQEDPENKIGVYLLHNQQTQQGYVGSSVDVDERGKEHFQLLKAGKHPNRRLQAAYAANPNFEFVSLVLGDRDAAFDYEQSIIDELGRSQVLLNISQDARYCRVPGLKHTEEAKAKIGAASKGHKYHLGRKHPPEFGAKVSERMKGHLVSSETREKIRQSKLGTTMPRDAVEKMRQTKIGKTASEETRLKMSQAQKGKVITEDQKAKLREARSGEFKPVSAEGQIFASINEAARQLGLNPGTIYHRVNSPNFPTWFFVTA